MKKLYWIFPCYNEEECLPFTSKSILAHFSELVSQKVISEDSRIVFVDDGSKDNTWSLIEELAKEPAVIGLRLSRNKGHQFALEAGLRYAYEKKAEITITMDVDLQDDIEAAK
ncbi:MAG: glycosyltransferase, partial [Bacilli bacterium]|nr:glycosyltransferase [Bacilli bacterium]